MAREFELAVRSNEFILHYQPLVHLPDAKPVGFEALVRWNRGDGEMLGPEAFLALAEKTGLIVPLGWWIVEEACRQAIDWADSGLAAPTTILVNLSRRQFAAAELTSRVKSILERLELDPSRLVFEITETTLFDDIDEATRTLEGLKEIGVGIALDDFGTGYSSLSALHNLPVDIVKIDSGFVSGLSREAPDPRGASPRLRVARAIIAIAHALEMTVVAEGVETSAQCESLSEAGCDLAQGLLFGNAQDPDAAMRAAIQLQWRGWRRP